MDYFSVIINVSKFFFANNIELLNNSYDSFNSMNWQKEPGADNFFSPITRSKRQLQCMEYDDCTQLKNLT